MKLTQKVAEGLTLQGRAEAIFFDEEIPGYGLRLRAGGSRKAIFQYKLGDKQRRITLGPPSAETRDAARKLYAKVRLGQDPASEKLEDRMRAAETFEATLKAYLPHARTRQRDSTYKGTERHLLADSKPLHGRGLAAIDRRAIAALLNGIAATNGAVTANRVRTSLSAFFAWCLRQGLLDANPIIGTGREVEVFAGSRP